MVLDLCGLCEAKHPRKQDTVKMPDGGRLAGTRAIVGRKAE